MPVQTIFKGPQFEIEAWVDGEDCQVLDFLAELRADSKSDYERLIYLMERTANEGVLRNNRQVRPLKNDIYEGS